MLKDITIGQYFPGRSFVHMLDPRVKIVISFLFIVLIFFVKTFIGYGFVFLFLAAIVAVSDIPVKYVVKGIRPLLFIILLTFFLNVFFTSQGYRNMEAGVFGIDPGRLEAEYLYGPQADLSDFGDIPFNPDHFANCPDRWDREPSKAP